MTCRQQRFFMVISVLGLIACPLFASGQKRAKRKPPAQNIQQQFDDFIYVLSPMKLGCEAPGVHLDLVEKGMLVIPIEACEHIRLTDGSQSLILQKLNDLRHHVLITDGPTALRYVRLLTSPETWFLWKSGKIAVEILAAGASLTLPNFGLSRQPRFLSSSDKMEGITGTMGILTHKAYQTGNFSPPSILPVDGGFQITRWLYVEDYSVSKMMESVQQVQEFVGTEGAYHQTVLKMISPPPSLPDTYFYIPKFE